jgi:hydroxymethylglutaryl-CoA lyase
LKFLQSKNSGSKAFVLEDQTLREAFQMHPRVVSLDSRAMLLRELAGAGLKRLQIGSLVRTDLIPQMAHTDRLLDAAADFPNLEPWVLVFNRLGFERADKAGFRYVALSASLSEIHNMRNLGCSVKQSLASCLQLADKALARGMSTRMGLQCAFGGPMLPMPEPGDLIDLFRPFQRIGVKRLALCDTAGRATPDRLTETLTHLSREFSDFELGLHLHGHPEQLSANLEAAWAARVDWLDVTLNGHGGCPFLPGRPPGNLSTLSAIDFMAKKGFMPSLDINKLLGASVMLERILTGSGRSMT